MSTTCQHHYLIEMPNGPVSRGRCKLCGAEKEFSNVHPFSLSWEDQAEYAHAARAARLTADVFPERGTEKAWR